MIYQSVFFFLSYVAEWVSLGKMQVIDRYYASSQLSWIYCYPFSWCMYKVSLRFMCGTWQGCHPSSDLWAHHLHCSPIPQDSCYVCPPWTFTSALPDTLLPLYLVSIVSIYNINAALSHICSTSTVLLDSILLNKWPSLII